MRRYGVWVRAFGRLELWSRTFTRRGAHRVVHGLAAMPIGLAPDFHVFLTATPQEEQLLKETWEEVQRERS